jgi:hypothetical protein
MLNVEGATAQETRDARAFAATMDHADIRGMVTAIGRMKPQEANSISRVTSLIAA